jgi:hypothetical protein
MKMTINVNKELHKAVKRAAFDEEMTIEQFIDYLMTKYEFAKIMEIVDNDEDI